MNTDSRLRLAALALATVAALVPAHASAPPPAVAVALTSTVGHDDNVYGVDTGPLAKIDSAYTALAARLSLVAAPGVLLAYSPGATHYFKADRENHVKHLLSASWKQSSGDFSWRAASDFVYVSGDDQGAHYGADGAGAHGSAFSTIIPRERREQVQNKTDLSLRRDFALGFARALGRLSYWDLFTSPPVVGVNYVDRYDCHGGIDLGRALRPDTGPGTALEVYLGYRHGYEFQDRDANPASPRHSSNHYDRFVVGCDGRLGSSLTLSGEAGWARHAFSENPAIYAGRANEDGLFTDLALTWAATAKDELRLKTAQSRTVSTTGVNNFLLTIHQVSWARVLAKHWSATLSARAMQAEYAPAARDDRVYGFGASVTHAFGPHWSASLSAHADRGRESHHAITGPASANREFDRNLVSVSVTWKR